MEREGGSEGKEGKKEGGKEKGKRKKGSRKGKLAIPIVVCFRRQDFRCRGGCTRRCSFIYRFGGAKAIWIKLKNILGS